MDELSSTDKNFRKEVLLAFERWFGFHQMNFWLCDENNDLYDPVTLNTDESITKDYLKNYLSMDQLTPHKLAHIVPRRRVISLLDIQTKKEYENSEYYNCFMKKYGFYNNTGVFLVRNSKITGLVDFVSEKEEKSITENEMMCLEILSRYLAPRVYDHTQPPYNKNRSSLPNSPLTAREEEVLLLVQRGYSNKYIAQTLFISVNTVKKHIQSLYIKFDVNNRTSLCFKVSSI